MYSPLRRDQLRVVILRTVHPRAGEIKTGANTRATKTKASFIEPMLLLRSERLPDGPGWIYELKLDGYRALAIKTGRKVELRSRNE